MPQSDFTASFFTTSLFQEKLIIQNTEGRKRHCFYFVDLQLASLWKSKTGKNIYFFFGKILRNEQHLGKLLLNISHLNCHTLRFHPEIQKLPLPCTP